MGRRVVLKMSGEALASSASDETIDSGVVERFARELAVARSAATSSAGTSSRRRYEGRAKATCTAMSWARLSSAPRISTSTAFTPRPACMWR